LLSDKKIPSKITSENAESNIATYDGKFFIKTVAAADGAQEKLKTYQKVENQKETEPQR
jgi:hypothetical protein